MKEFLLEYYASISLSIEFLAAVAGLLFYKKYKASSSTDFIWFLVYLSICDFIGSYNNYIDNDGPLSFLKGTVFTRNFWWSTLFWKIGAIMFFVFYYSKILSREVFKSVIKYSGSIFFVFCVVYIVFNWEDYFVMFFPIIDVFGAIIIFMCTSFYFYEILNSESILTFYKSLNFYISAAIFIWWLIITPLVFYDIYNSRYDWNFIFLKWQIYLFANIVMYLTFTFALIFCKPDIDNKYK